MADTNEEYRETTARPPTHRAAIVAKLKASANEIRKQGVTSLALFGSRVRGDERHDSDLDVLIGYSTERPFTLYDLVRVGRLLEDLTGLDVHVTTRDSLPPHRLQRVLKGAVNVL